MKLKRIVISIIFLLMLTGCGASTNNTATDEPSASTEATNEIIDLTGEWVQVNADASMTHTAVITDNEIEIYWNDEENDTKMLYWAGSFEPLTDSKNKYEWDSVNNTEKTGSALLASPDETKHFTYDNGQLSYEASAMGVTKTVKLIKK